MTPTAKEMDTEGRINGRDAHLVKAAPELFDLLVEVVEAYEFGAFSPRPNHPGEDRPQKSDGRLVTGWTKDIPSSPVAAEVCRDSSAVTPFCDIYCIRWFDTRLHSIECEAANRMDPIFPDRKIDDVLPDRSLIREALEGTPYEEVE